MASSNDDFFGMSIAGVFIGLVAFGKGFMTLRRKRLIENTPTSKVRSLAMGLSEVYGDATPYKGNLLKSPFSGKDCFYYRYEVEEYRRSGKRSRWVTIKKGSKWVLFHLKDDTGEVVVDPKEAEVDIPIDFTMEPGSGKTISPPLSEFMNQEGLKLTGFLGFSKRLRFSEYFIAPGDKLYILGTADDNPFVGEGTAVEGFRDVMIQKGKGRLFYIADKSEKSCLKQHRISMTLQIYGGGAAFVGSLAYILFKFNFF